MNCESAGPIPLVDQYPRQKSDEFLSLDHYQLLVEAGLGLLSSLGHLEELLDNTLDYALRITRAQAGNVYLVQEDTLKFRASRNLILDAQGGTNFREEKRSALSEDKIASHVALTGELLFIEDVYNLPSHLPLHFAREIDQDSGFRTQSMLVIPLIGLENRITGVLQLINHQNEFGVAPFPPSLEIAARTLAAEVGVSLQNTLLQQQLRSAEEETVYRLCLAAETRDNETAGHLHRTSRYMHLLAFSFRGQRIWAKRLEASAPLHDIGKIGIPDGILNNNGPLTAAEWETMRTHTTIGHRILVGSSSDLLRLGADIALSHHEKWDGSGYPQGIPGETIPIEGRLMALVDVFDALTTRRPYKDAWPLRDAFAHIQKESGRHFDPSLVELFFENREAVVSICKRFS